MVDDWEVYEKLSYKWKREGSTKELLELFKESSVNKRIGKDYPEDYWLVYLSVLSERHKRRDFKKLLSHYNEHYGNLKIDNYLSVATRINLGDRSLNEKYSFVLKKLKNNSAKRIIKKMCKGKTIAVVGNSGYEIGKNKGQQIDEHDFIVRFNNYQISGYSEDYGKKTNVWVRTLENDLVDRSSEDFDLIVYSANLLHFPLNRNIVEELYQLLSNGKKITSFDIESYIFLNNNGIPWPTSGASLIVSLYLALGSLEKVDFYGFSFLENNPDYKHYYNNDKESNRLLLDHDMKNESELLKKIISTPFSSL